MNLTQFEQQSVIIYSESLRQHNEKVALGADPNGLYEFKGDIFHADAIAEKYLAPQFKNNKGERYFINQKWKEKLDNMRRLAVTTHPSKLTPELMGFNEGERCTRRYYSLAMVDRALQLGMKIG